MFINYNMYVIINHGDYKMSKRRLIAFYILYLMYAICVNIVHPITVKYVDSLNLPDAYFGFFVSLMSLGQVVGAILFGFLSDKIGRKWLIVIGLFGYCFAQIGFGFINTYPIIILLFRFLAGIFVAAPATLFVSMCLDYCDEDKKVKMLAIHSSCYILGTSFGYEIGGALYNYLQLSISNVFIFQICFTVFTALLFSLLVKDVFKKQPKNEEINDKNNHQIRPIVYFLLLSLMVVTIAQILINKYLDTYIIHIGYEPAILGHYVLITGVVSALSNIAIIPLIKKVKGRALEYCLLGFLALSAILTFITFLVKTNILYLLFSTHLIYIVIKGFITPLEQNELSLYTDSKNKGKITGLRQTVISFGNVCGPLIGSAVYTNGSPVIFIVAASIIIVSLIMYLTYFTIKRRQA